LIQLLPAVYMTVFSLFPALEAPLTQDSTALSIEGSGGSFSGK